MLANTARTSRAATCEEWDEEAQTTLPDTRTSANVAAKRSKPELASTKSRRRRTVDGEGDKMGRTSTSIQDDASIRKAKRSAGLKLDTSFPERESRLYSSGPPVERPRRSASRPAAKRSASKPEPEQFVRHRQGDCWICDAYGHHMVVPLEASGLSKEKSIPQSPLATKQPPAHQAPSTTKRPEASAVQSRPNRSQSYRDQRPMSFHAGMTPEAYHPLSSQPFSTADWNVPPTPTTPYTHTSYAQTPTNPLHNQYPDHRQPFPPQYNQQVPPPRPRPPEPYRGTSTHGEPIIQQAPFLRDEPPLSRKMSQSEHQRSRTPSVSREEDARRMPPPQIIPVARRPSIINAKTSMSTPVSHPSERRYSNNGSVPAQLPHKERRSDPPPSSYREPPSSAYQSSSQDRPLPRKTASYQDTKTVTKVNSSVPGLDRRPALPTTERHEIEAEAYQRSRGTKLQPLTVDAVSKISRHSDSGSQRSINTSSRGSSGGKTKTTVASSDITMTINGVTLGISGDSAENHSIKIQPKRHGGVNISVDERDSSGRRNKATSLQQRSGSTTSSSKHSRKSSEKELRRSRDDSSDRNLDPTTGVSSRSDKASLDDSPRCGFAFG